MHDNGLLGSAKPGHTKPNDQRLTVAIKARGPILKFVWTKCVCQLSLLLFSLLVWMKNWVRLMHCCQTRHNFKCTEYRHTSASIIESKVPVGGFLLPKVTNSSTATNTKTDLFTDLLVYFREVISNCLPAFSIGRFLRLQSVQLWLKLFAHTIHQFLDKQIRSVLAQFQ